MKEIIEQFISQIEQDQKLSTNTKCAYKSDLSELIVYVISNNVQLSDINHLWVKAYLKNLEITNKERNSFNRRASTFRIFLRFLYKHKLTPTNFSLIVSSQPTLIKPVEENEMQDTDIKKIIEESKLQIDQKLILFMIGRLGLSATQIAVLNTHQIDFENKQILLSDLEKIKLDDDLFTLLREYLLNLRPNLPNSEESLSLFLTSNGKPVSETDIYKLIKNLSSELSLTGRLTTRSLRKSSESKFDFISIQREILNIISPS